MIGVFLLDL